MKPILALALGLPLLGLDACGSCGSRSSVHESLGAAAGRALVVGTVIDAATGEPVSGARIEGPLGHTAQSDAHGRFEIADLPEGTSGEVRASASGGRKAQVTLRALAAGRLEVVLQLTTR